MAGRIRVAAPEERTADNVIFHSKREKSRYLELMMLMRSGYISDLQLQPKFPLVVAGQHICDYKADFQYVTKDGRTVIEDSKGMTTEIYRLKCKLFHALYPKLRIIEV